MGLVEDAKELIELHGTMSAGGNFMYCRECGTRETGKHGVGCEIGTWLADYAAHQDLHKRLVEFVRESSCECYDEYGKLRPNAPCDRCRLLKEAGE